MSLENEGYERPGPQRISGREAVIERYATAFGDWISEGLEHEETGSDQAAVPLIQPEGVESEGYSVKGRIEGENRVMLNRIYGRTRARLHESTLHYLAGRSGTIFAEIVTIPVGKVSLFEEVTQVQKVGTEYIPISSSVTFVRNGKRSATIPRTPGSA